MGDGAGILVQIPDRFFREEMAAQGVTLPKAGEYAVGHIFMPRDPSRIEHYKKVIVDVIGEEGQQFLASVMSLSTIPRFPRRRISQRQSRTTRRSSSAPAAMPRAMPISSASCSSSARFSPTASMTKAAARKRRISIPFPFFLDHRL